jgi:ribosome-binding protein aMBF1 (putative translation factor)
MTNKEKFLTLVSERQTSTIQHVQTRIENRSWLKHSQKIALKVLTTLKEQGLSQKDLAERLQVSPQIINRWVKGQENFTLETIMKLEKALGIQLLSIIETNTTGNLPGRTSVK